MSYTAITFAPVQGFIEKSRKLRDLYGSSFILSYLAKTLCEAARKHFNYEEGNGKDPVISPAIINVTQGTPNQIIIRGEFPEEKVKTVFNDAWKTIVHTCRKEIEQRVKVKYSEKYWEYHWDRVWNAWVNYAWEFFYAYNEGTVTDVRQALNEVKRSRNWIGINWVGESSTLSGADEIAWPGMTDKFNPKTGKISDVQAQIEIFYRQLSQVFSESMIAANEQLSIPELIKRLITLKDIAKQLNLQESEYPSVEIPSSFKDISRHEDNRWTGWFQGDGDKIGDYFKSMVNQGKSEEEILHKFSKAMMDWGKFLSIRLYESRIIYAGGDDFLGVFYSKYSDPKLTPKECLEWFYKFRSSAEKPHKNTTSSEVWSKHKQSITVSVGFVWAAPGVPQRDVLQHCREAEQSAKKSGRDRIALRILFNSGNHLEWTCPWWLLREILEGYCDRSNNTTEPNWTHIYNDVAILENRHAFSDQNTNVAKALFEVYFPDVQWHNIVDQHNQFNTNQRSGILGERKQYTTDRTDAGELDNEAVNQAINNWVINLAKVGFHLLGNTHKKTAPSELTITK
ncbi:MAG: type III-B CRISPR-associated protein Cas10/Cmr2 [Microcoleaceae cyanobacterium]